MKATLPANSPERGNSLSDFLSMDSFFAKPVQKVLMRRHRQSEPWIRPLAIVKKNGLKTTTLVREVLDNGGLHYPFIAWEAAEIYLQRTAFPEYIGAPIATSGMRHFEFERCLICDPIFFSDLISALATWHDCIDRGRGTIGERAARLRSDIARDPRGAEILQVREQLPPTSPVQIAAMLNAAERRPINQPITENAVSAKISMLKSKHTKTAQRWEPELSAWLSTKKVLPE